MDAPPSGPPRRVILGAIGLGVAGVFAGAEWLSSSPTTTTTAGWAQRTITLAQWRQTRGQHYLIGHRGSGDVRPEHTIQAYDAAMAWGANALEISTSSTSDGVLVCMHDLTYDRTTNGRGAINAQPSSVLDRIRVTQPQLGQAWMTPPLPRVPRLDDVLARYGGHAVLCIEAKRDADYAAMIALVERHGLQDSVIVKAYYTSDSISSAKRAGYPVFAFLDPSVVGSASIADLASTLSPDTDYLGLPTTGSADRGTLLDPAVVQEAVASHVPVWVYPAHRRSEVDYFRALGVAGSVASSYRYLSTRSASTATDKWRSAAVASGEMTKDPSSVAYAPQWDRDGTLTLAAPAIPHYLALGQFSPIRHAQRSYQIDFEARWNALPADGQDHLDLVFAHSDDAYYEDGYGRSDGYHAILRADGSLELLRHDAGSTQPSTLAPAAATPAASSGQWMSLRLRVSPSKITWSRRDPGSQATLTVSDASFRGGYLHIGRSNTDPHASASFRRLRVR